MSQVVQVLCDVTGRVEVLHSMGWAHRDLEPGNIMFLSHKLTWVLIDFGVATQLHEAARVRGTPLYATPEVAQAVLKGKGSMRAIAALDTWSLGINGLELMLGYRPLGALSDPDSVFLLLVLSYVQSDVYVWNLCVPRVSPERSVGSVPCIVMPIHRRFLAIESQYGTYKPHRDHEEFYWCRYSGGL